MNLSWNMCTTLLWVNILFLSTPFFRKCFQILVFIFIYFYVVLYINHPFKGDSSAIRRTQIKRRVQPVLFLTLSFWLIVYFSPIRKFSVATYDICISGLSPMKLLLVAVGLSTQLEVSKPSNFQWISFFITKLFPPHFWRGLNPDSYRFLLIRQPAPDLRSFCC